jgi:hypothetical protein
VYPFVRFDFSHTINVPKPITVVQTPITVVQTSITVVQTSISVVQTSISIVQTSISVVQTSISVVQTSISVVPAFIPTFSYPEILHRNRRRAELFSAKQKKIIKKNLWFCYFSYLCSLIDYIITKNRLKTYDLE